MKLTPEEKGFLICCITMAAGEGFYMFPRYEDYYKREGGVKYEGLSEEDIGKLLAKLGADVDDMHLYYQKC